VSGPLRNQAKQPAWFLRGRREPPETAPVSPCAGVSQPKLPGCLPPNRFTWVLRNGNGNGNGPRERAFCWTIRLHAGYLHPPPDERTSGS